MTLKTSKKTCIKHGLVEHNEIRKDTFICLKCHEELCKTIEMKFPIETKAQVKRQKKLGYKVGDLAKRFTPQKIKEWYKRKFKKKSLYLVMMYLRNGKVDIFTISTAAGHFEAYGGAYFIDTDMARHDLTSGLDLLVYHQDCAMPFRIDFDIAELDKMLSKDMDSVKKAIKPSSFKEYFYSTIIEKIIAGVALANKLRILMILIIVTLIVTVINLLVSLKSSGAL